MYGHIVSCIVIYSNIVSCSAIYYGFYNVYKMLVISKRFKMSLLRSNCGLMELIEVYFNCI
jgi:hypothetical protein